MPVLDVANGLLTIVKYLDSTLSPAVQGDVCSDDVPNAILESMEDMTRLI
jgi:hypothetical protein